MRKWAKPYPYIKYEAPDNIYNVFWNRVNPEIGIRSAVENFEKKTKIKGVAFMPVEAVVHRAIAQRIRDRIIKHDNS